MDKQATQAPTGSDAGDRLSTPQPEAVDDRLEVGDAAAGMHALFAAGGEMGALMAQLDWAASPLGPVSGWPQSLRSVLSILLTSQQPILIWWGPELVQFYNDAYRPILGRSMHPAALGARGTVTWSGIWEVIAPMIATVQRGESTLVENGLLILDRNGYPEEGYFDYAYSPIRDESGSVGGIFAACADMTTRVIGDRRLRLLRDLSADVGASPTLQAAADRAVQTLATATHDVPFAAIFLINAEGSISSASAVGLAGPDIDPTAWPLDQASAAGGPVVLTGLQESGRQLPGGPWTEPAHTAVMIPLATRTAQPDGVVILGVSPRRALDDDYLSFLAVVAGQLAAALTSGRAREEERAKAAALAALERAKAAFVANVSHEFRTPLTLLLGPLERCLAEPQLPAAVRDELEAAHRNAERLLRLTNTLLDFSQMQDGRFDASFEPVDLPLLTAQITRSFQSAFEHSGVDLVVDCPSDPAPVFVDVGLWEKVVLNLLSNAYKFTFSGSVTVSTRISDGRARLVVADTGEGIPAEELPRLFERFHRVAGMRSRSHEGTGIGLAFVYDLVHLHGGAITASSATGAGTTFTIDLPLGAAHLPADQCRQPRSGPPQLATAGFMADSLLWLQAEHAPRLLAPPAAAPAEEPGRPTILVVDDNQDMRHYLVRTLQEHFDVRTASDGAAALAALEGWTPDLVLTDVMMPNLTGLELTRRLRSDPATAHLPIIMLSARAGPGAAVDGIGAGADDYLTKPFTTAELLARCRTNIELAALRAAALREAELRYEREHAVALQLQYALLPGELPTMDNLTVAAHYQPCTQDAKVGGDWYDVIDLGDGHVVAVIGDVVGHDLRAAATMARYRNAIRAYAIEDSSPAAILDRVDQFADRLESEFATVVVVTLETGTGVLRYANAGHPPPLIGRAGSVTRTLDEALYPPLGLSPHPRPEGRERLLVGETLLMYTDGLIERRDEAIHDGIDRLTKAFEALTPEHPLGKVPEQLAVDLVGSRSDDDVAVLALTYLPTPGHQPDLA